MQVTMKNMRQNTSPTSVNVMKPSAAKICSSISTLTREDVNVAELSPKYRHIIDKVRKIVKLFRKSPVKNDSILQKYVKEDHQGKELSLLLDCPTRWNSLVTMLSRFSLLRTSIQKAMIDLKAPEQATDADFAVVDEIVAALEPVALAVQLLSRKDVNLLSAEAAIQFCVAQLHEQQSELGKVMAAALLSRVSDRYAMHSTVDIFSLW